MTRSRSLGALSISLVAVGIAYASAFHPEGMPGWAAWVFLLGAVGSLVAVAALGAIRGSGRLGRLGWVFAAMLVLLVGGMGGALLIPDPSPEGPLVLGLPPGAALVIYVVGLVPLVVVPLAYAWTFPELGFRSGELEDVRRRARDVARQDGSRDGLPDGSPEGGAS